MSSKLAGIKQNQTMLMTNQNIEISKVKSSGEIPVG